MTSFGLMAIDMKSKRIHPFRFEKKLLPNGSDCGRYLDRDFHNEGFEDVEAALAELKKDLQPEAIISTHLLPIFKDHEPDSRTVLFSGWKGDGQITPDMITMLSKHAMSWIPVEQKAGVLGMNDMACLIAYDIGRKCFYTLLLARNPYTLPEQNYRLVAAPVADSPSHPSKESCLKCIMETGIPAHLVYADQALLLPDATTLAKTGLSLQTEVLSETTRLSPQVIKTMTPIISFLQIPPTMPKSFSMQGQTAGRFLPSISWRFKPN